MNEQDFSPEMYELMMKEAEQFGLCPNCMHTYECDASDPAHACDPDRNGMEHVCPPNTPESEERYHAALGAA